MTEFERGFKEGIEEAAQRLESCVGTLADVKVYGAAIRTLSPPSEQERGEANHPVCPNCGSDSDAHHITCDADPAGRDKEGQK